MRSVGWNAGGLILLTACLAFSGCGSGPGERGADRPPDEAGAPADPDGSRPITVGALTVRSARILEAAAGARTSVYAKIENTGAPDHLAAIRSDDAAAGSLHHMRDQAGYMLMEPVATLEIPAGGALTLHPGASHGMLERLERPLLPGDSVRVVFGFASGTTVEVVAPVASLLDLVEVP